MKKVFSKYYPLIFISFSFSEFIDFTETVKFNVSTDREDYRKGEDIKIIFDFDIKDNFRIYSVDVDKAPISGETYFEYYDSTNIENFQPIIEPKPQTKFDKNFNQETSFRRRFSTFQIGSISQAAQISKNRTEGTVYATACDPSQCIRIVEDFFVDINVSDGEVRSEFIFVKNELKNELKNETDKGFIPFIIIFSLGNMGFLALLTPYVFPMINNNFIFHKIGYISEKNDKNHLTPL